jgi:hypothetical protein
MLVTSDDDSTIRAAALNLTNALSGLVRAIDAMKDEGAAARDIPEDLPDELERLAARLNAARGLSEESR